MWLAIFDTFQMPIKLYFVKFLLNYQHYLQKKVTFLFHENDKNVPNYRTFQWSILYTKIYVNKLKFVTDICFVYLNDV